MMMMISKCYKLTEKGLFVIVFFSIFHLKEKSFLSTNYFFRNNETLKTVEAAFSIYFKFAVNSMCYSKFFEGILTDYCTLVFH